jgi:hypothetical protein
VSEVRPVRVGEGVVEALAPPGTGRVVAVFRRAVYLSYPRGLIALVGTDAEPGPLHAHVEVMPLVRAGDEVRVRAGAPVWRAPPLPAPGAVVGVLEAVLDHVPVLDLAVGTAGSSVAALGLRGGPAGSGEGGGSGDPADDPCAALRRDGLAATVRALAGRGAGLTPAGDDVAAGLLLAAHTAGVPEPDLQALAEAMSTHAISRAFLGWAARGRSLAAVHDLAAACADGDVRAARCARARLAAVGHTSGLDLAHGLLLGCTYYAGATGTGHGSGTGHRSGTGHGSDTHRTDTHRTDTHRTDTHRTDTHRTDTHRRGGP